VHPWQNVCCSYLKNKIIIGVIVYFKLYVKFGHGAPYQDAKAQEIVIV
jgi:hypothetical protein